ncbi:hypothetical protein ABVL59_004738 [Salmonella enterica]|nr:hypothetical protein [Salmonella enterica]EDR7079648.1 hypothetical protein [Salmonella enterica subsp. enterica serovar Gatuni]EDT0686889.1 hypothetical protein [Salmonella enterica subsp. enterica serovar Kokomlemle]EHL0896150.1 hypothetical protein [Salmonella enterica subsp. enterica serovar Durban]EAW9895617.1 hypothetical protein [Salmonella enterica]
MKIKSSFLYALLLSTLAESAVLMAAPLTAMPSPVSGNGKVNLSMNLEVPTCSIEVSSGTDLDINIYFNSTSGDLASGSAPTQLYLRNCQGKSINLSMHANNYDEVRGEAGFAPNNASESVSTEVLRYGVYLMVGDYNTLYGYSPSEAFPMNNSTRVVTVVPDSNIYFMAFITRVFFNQFMWKGGNSDWYTSYTYNFTYA